MSSSIDKFSMHSLHVVSRHGVVLILLFDSLSVVMCIHFDLVLQEDNLFLQCLHLVRRITVAKSKNRTPEGNYVAHLHTALSLVRNSKASRVACKFFLHEYGCQSSQRMRRSATEEIKDLLWSKTQNRQQKPTKHKHQNKSNPKNSTRPTRPGNLIDLSEVLFSVHLNFSSVKRSWAWDELLRKQLQLGVIHRMSAYRCPRDGKVDSPCEKRFYRDILVSIEGFTKCQGHDVRVLLSESKILCL